MTRPSAHEKQDWVNATLHNDESSSDEELVRFFVNGGLSVDVAQNAVNQRDKCLNDMHYTVGLE